MKLTLLPVCLLLFVSPVFSQLSAQETIEKRPSNANAKAESDTATQPKQKPFAVKPYGIRYADDEARLKAAHKAAVKLNRKGLLKNGKKLLEVYQESLKTDEKENAKTDKKVTSDPVAKAKDHQLPKPEMVKTLPLDQLYKQRLPGVVNVMYHGKTYSGPVATAFVISESGLCVINYHTLQLVDDLIFANTADGGVHAMTKVLFADRDTDIALVQLSGSGFSPIPIRKQFPVGMSIALIAHPEGYLDTLTTGIVSRKYKTDNFGNGNYINAFSTTAEFGVGSSGGPILDLHGNVIGAVCLTRPVIGMHDGEELVQMMVRECIPLDIILKYLDEQKQ